MNPAIARHEPQSVLSVGIVSSAPTCAKLLWRPKKKSCKTNVRLPPFMHLSTTRRDGSGRRARPHDQGIRVVNAPCPTRKRRALGGAQFASPRLKALGFADGNLGCNKQDAAALWSHPRETGH